MRQSVEYGMDVKVVMDTLARSPTHVALTQLVRVVTQMIHANKRLKVNVAVSGMRVTVAMYVRILQKQEHVALAVPVMKTTQNRSAIMQEECIKATILIVVRTHVMEVVVTPAR